MAGFHSTFIPDGLRRFAGVYVIRNIRNGKEYIGSGVDLLRRARCHWDDLSARRHKNTRLQNSWYKHGAENFRFIILELVADVALLLAREQHWINTRKPFYNICMVSGSRLGVTHGQPAKDKISAFHLGRKRSEETRRRIGDAHRGKTVSAEARARISAAKIGKPCAPMSAQTKVKISASRKGRPGSRLGIPMSEEAKAKLSASMQGNTNGRGGLGRKHSEATKRAWSAKRRGCKRTPEAIAAAIAGRQGYRHSEETKAKMRSAHLRRAIEKKGETDGGQSDPPASGTASGLPLTP